MALSVSRLVIKLTSKNFDLFLAFMYRIRPLHDISHRNKKSFIVVLNSVYSMEFYEIAWIQNERHHHAIAQNLVEVRHGIYCPHFLVFIWVSPRKTITFYHAKLCVIATTSKPHEI